MHGGTRDGSGRKIIENKKKAVTIYLNDSEIEAIEKIPLPNQKTFSKKCRELISIGIQEVTNQFDNTENTIKFIDLFCGLGGIRLGFEQALSEYGLVGKCVFSSDIKPAAIKAYHKNFNHNPKCDITTVSPASIPNFDFLLAGFPCQAFSQAGLGLGFQDTRGTLFFDIAKILMEKKPLGFVLENVEGLVNHDKGKTFKVILSTLNELGYNIQYKVLNGKDFGLAQSRNRIYIIGYRSTQLPELKDFKNTYSTLKDVIEQNVPPVESEFTNKLLNHFNIQDIYGKAIKDKRGGENNIHSWEIGLKGEISKEQTELLNLLLKQRRNKKWAEVIGIDWMDGMPLTIEMISTFYDNSNLAEMLEDLVNKGYLVFEYPKKKVNNKRVPDETLRKGYNIVTGKLSFEFSKILSPNDVTPTLVATDVSKLAVPVNNGIRKLTVKEGLRLFGFPENYDLSQLSESEAFDLLGNTVCVPVIKAVSNKLLETHLKYKKIL
ncbi:DNA (cytosine-5-)-methyltransferase [Lactococcus lactis]|uniref:DNA (cytosine-5-)-methyltransferase n=1 Tax=Lactococcus lactis TaxID=1358 RepID=UPI00288F930B|nr:DNA (cytosine-5-)-methyltransferase [Lactococcus lactis]MDT2909672.1 DNA (cytosine-5-)-methyltransferase [Lactococcus lactis]MDT2925740.1 DNA (cytosine-5-)-methyltransferase [Lactococcus lactis]MDT2952855.1 DNA (cytosine-5-)-methyltransferase [Lactococcus lactis]